MAAFDDGGAKVMESLYDKEEVDAFKETGRYKATMVPWKGLSMLENGVEADKYMGKKEYLKAGKSGSKVVADGADIAETLTGNKKLGGAGSLVKAGGNTLSAIDHFKKGEYLEGGGDVASALGNTLKGADKLGLAGARRVAGPIAALSDGAEAYKSFRDGDVVGGIEHTLDAGSSTAAAFGPGGAPAAAIMSAGAGGMRWADRGQKFAKDHELFGKYANGETRDISDVAFDEAQKANLDMRAALGDSTAAKIVAEIAGGRQLVESSLGGGVVAAGLGAAGRGEDLYNGAKGIAGSVKDYAVGKYDETKSNAALAGHALGHSYDIAKHYAGAGYDAASEAASGVGHTVTDWAKNAYHHAGDLAAGLFHGLF